MKFLILIFLFQFSSFAEEKDFWNQPQTSVEEQRFDLLSIQHKVAPKWESLKRKQESPEWIKQQLDLQMAGQLYQKGWIGSTVSRQIVPDFKEGWLVVDTVTIDPKLMLKGAILAGNILLQQSFPYIQAGIVHQKSLINVRPVQTYKEALKAKPFNLKSIPLTAQEVRDNLEEGEVINTVVDGGFWVRAGGGIMNLIGLELPVHLNIGPKAKVTLKETMKVSISKEGEHHAVISLEKKHSLTNGIGFGIGFFMDDLIDIPVSVGIGSAGGWYPLMLNHKDTRTDLKASLFKIDLSTPEGEIAYNKFIQRDFTAIEDLLEADHPSVQREMVKEGHIHSVETNFAINLIFWRTGYRNLFVEAKYNTKLRNGNEFEYEEVSQQLIRNKKTFSGVEDNEEKYSVLIPLKVKFKDGQTDKDPFGRNQIGTFILDSNFLYQDSKTWGEELIEVQEHLQRSGNMIRIPMMIDPDRNYRSVLVKVHVRFSAAGIDKVLKSSTNEQWEALAVSFGLPDPIEWKNPKTRSDYEAVWDDDEEDPRYEKAKRIVYWMKKIKKLKTPSEKARYMIKKLKDSSKGHYFHHMLMELAGANNLMVQGMVRGKHFN